MKRMLIIVSCFCCAVIFNGCAQSLSKPTLLGSEEMVVVPSSDGSNMDVGPATGLAPVPSANTGAPGPGGGVEQTPTTSVPVSLTAPSGSAGRKVSFRVSENNKIVQVYTTMIPDESRRSQNVRPSSRQINFTNVPPGTYYINMCLSSGRWAVEQDPPANAPHRALTFRVEVSINDGPWVELGSADTEHVDGRWWNLKVIVP